MAQTVEERIQDLLVEQLGLEPAQVTPEARLLDDLGADSLDGVEIVMALEEEFNLQISDEDGETFKKVGDIQAYISKNSKY